MPNSNDALAQELDWYIANQAELVRQYDGKVVVIKDKEVKSVHDSLGAAAAAALEEYAPGSFLVQLVSPGTEAYKQTFHSRVSFA